MTAFNVASGPNQKIFDYDFSGSVRRYEGGHKSSLNQGQASLSTKRGTTRFTHIIQSRKGDIYLLLICVLDISLLCYLLSSLRFSHFR